MLVFLIYLNLMRIQWMLKFYYAKNFLEKMYRKNNIYALTNC